MKKHGHAVGLFIGAILVLLASALWVGAQRSELRRVRAALADPARHGSGFAPGDAGGAPPSAVVWSDPAAASGGGAWVYDLFSPPAIYYNHATQTFGLRWEPPTQPGPARPFGVELVAIRRDLFRLQLVGYAGAEGDWRGVFENALTLETFLARPGRVVADLDIRIESVDLRRDAIVAEDDASARERIAVARVRDQSTGESVELTSQGRKYLGPLIATLSPTGGGPRVEAAAGAEFDLGGNRFKIESIDVANVAVEVTRRGVDGEETRTLRRSEPLAP